MSRCVIFAALFLSACGQGTKEDRQTTETRMDDIDSLEGTISDDMINVDEATEEGPFEAAPATGPATPKKGKAEESEDDPEVPPETDDKAEAE